jgi:hypothetical protein
MFTADDWPRRGALSALVASGLALVGLSQGGTVGAAKKKNKKKKGKTPPAKLTLLETGEAQFSVGEGGSDGAVANCPPGSFVVSGTYTMTNPNCAPVIVGFAQLANGWQLTVECPAEQSSADNTVQALCLKGATIQ